MRGGAAQISARHPRRRRRRNAFEQFQEYSASYVETGFRQDNLFLHYFHFVISSEKENIDNLKNA